MARAASSTKRKSTTPKTVQSKTVSEKPSSTSKRAIPQMTFKRSYLFIAVGVVLIVALLYYFRNVFIVATVNGEPITRLAVIKELEAQGGKQVTDSLVTQALIRQDAKAKGVSASQEEIDQEIQTVEELYEQQGQDLEQVLSLRGMSRDDLVSQIELKILLDKLVGNVEVTEEEVTEFIEQNNEAYGGTLTEEDVRAQLEDQKLSEKSSEYITNLQETAQIQYFLEY